LRGVLPPLDTASPHRGALPTRHWSGSHRGRKCTTRGSRGGPRRRESPN